MKKLFMLFVSAAAATLFISGCCSKSCAEKSRCDLLGKWQIYILNGDKLESLPVKPQPAMELLAGGKMKFHYAKDNKAMCAEGKWKKVKDTVVISSLDGKTSKSFKIDDDELQMVVGKGDALPENTILVLKK